jgi:hypothetical protein
MVLATASGTPQHVATLTLCHGAMAACFYAATAVVVLPIRGFHRLVRSGLGMTGWPECKSFYEIELEYPRAVVWLSGNQHSSYWSWLLRWLILQDGWFMLVPLEWWLDVALLEWWLHFCHVIQGVDPQL